MGMTVDLYQLHPAHDGAGTAVADQRLTVDDTEGGVQLSGFHPNTTHVLYSVEGAQCRFTLDSSAPTTTNGHLLEAGDTGIFPVSWALAAKFIKTTETDATIHASPLMVKGG